MNKYVFYHLPLSYLDIMLFRTPLRVAFEKGVCLYSVSKGTLQDDLYRNPLCLAVYPYSSTVPSSSCRLLGRFHCLLSSIYANACFARSVYIDHCPILRALSTPPPATVSAQSCQVASERPKSKPNELSLLLGPVCRRAPNVVSAVTPREVSRILFPFC